MEAIEVTARTVEEAIEKALSQLGLSRSEVKIEVLQEGRSGILGIGSEEATVRVTPLKPEEEVDLERLTREVVEKLLFLMKIPATVKVTKQDGYSLKVEVEDGKEELGLLIGRRGDNLANFQYIVNFILSRKLKSAVRVMVDVAGYRQRRQRELEELALQVADLVKSTRRSITLEPMPAKDRRVIHLTLREQPGVSTKSIGTGENRQVEIVPQREGEIEVES